MLCIHGLGSYRKAFDRNITQLSKKFRCICVDLPGHGESLRPYRPVTISYYTEQLVHFIEALQLNKVILVGHSMGAQISLSMAVQQPSIIQKLVLLAPAGFETFTEWESQWLLSLTNPELLKNLTTEQVVQNIKANFYRLPTEAQFIIQERINIMGSPIDYDYYCKLIYQNTQAMLNEPIYQLLGEISHPCLVLFGEDDQLIPNRILHPLETSRTIAKKGCEALRACKLKMIPEAGHFLMFEKPDFVNEVVINFVYLNGYQ